MTNQKIVSRYSNWLMFITSIHHLYGALIYNTPERLHVLAISIPVIILTYFLEKGIQHKKSKNRILVWLYAIIVAIPSLLLIGVLEGIINHIVKNILFFSGVPVDTIKELYSQLYDPTLIEMPNDMIFELTGIVQGLLAIPLTIYWIRFIQDFRMRKSI